MSDNIYGHACQICGTPNIASATYCSKCGTWLFDTKREAKPLTKAEFNKLCKKEPNIHNIIATVQLVTVLGLLYGVCQDSAPVFEGSIILYFIFITLYNFALGAALTKKREEVKEEQPPTKLSQVR